MIDSANQEAEDSVEIRLYAESIEQGEVLGRRVEAAFPWATVAIVRMPSSRTKAYKLLKRSNRSMAGIFNLANPDFILSLVNSTGEHAFGNCEISDAVKTEDHEMQRYPQVLSAMAYDLVHLKISPHVKASLAAHGGNVNFDPLTVPRILRDECGFRGAFMVDWPTGDNDFVLDRNPDFPSCPADGAIPLFDAVLRAISTTIQSGVLPAEGSYRFTNCVWNNLDERAKSSYEAALNESPNRASLLKEWGKMKIRPGKGTLRKRMLDEDEVLVTVPRFDRDSPGPGEVMGYGTMSQASTVGIGYTGRDRTLKITSSACNSEEKVMRRFFEIFDVGRDKMPVALLALLRDAWDENKSSKIDITRRLQRLAESGKMAKWLTTFIFFADYLIIHDRPKRLHPVVFHWDREVILGVPVNASSMAHLRVYNRVNHVRPLTLISPRFRPVHNGKEDYVTWAAAQIMKRHDWRINAISYPGAQGDGAILPGSEKSLSRSRTYVDALLSHTRLGRNHERVGMLLESKDKERKIGPDVAKLRSLVDININDIRATYRRLGVHDVDRFLTCVAFGVETLNDNERHSFDREALFRGGMDFAFTVSDANTRYQLTDIRTGKIIDSGLLPLHSMHGLRV